MGRRGETEGRKEGNEGPQGYNKRVRGRVGGRGERVKVKGREARKIKEGGSGCKELKVHRRYSNKVKGMVDGTGEEGRKDKIGRLHKSNEIFSL